LLLPLAGLAYLTLHNLLPLCLALLVLLLIKGKKAGAFRRSS